MILSRVFIVLITSWHTQKISRLNESNIGDQDLMLDASMVTFKDIPFFFPPFSLKNYPEGIGYIRLRKMG